MRHVIRDDLWQFRVSIGVGVGRKHSLFQIVGFGIIDPENFHKHITLICAF